MSFCTSCGHDLDQNDRFCAVCGHATAAGMPAPEASATPAGTTKKAAANPRRALIVGAAVVVAGIAMFGVLGLGGKGCSSVDGSVTATGESALGEMTFAPTRCRSGQPMGFFGVVLLGDGPDDGGILVINDVANKGKHIKVEVPGSCKPPDREVCTVVEVTPDMCSRFDLKVAHSNTTVNDVRAVDGHLRVSCTMPEGGTLKGEVTFETCH